MNQMMLYSKRMVNGVEVLTGENEYLKLGIVPAMGGKVVSIYNKPLQKEFLWRNGMLPFKANHPGEDYDANFLGGIDELIPNDMAETIDSIAYPDHGELWTTPLQYELVDGSISVQGMLKLSGLYYKKTIYAEPGSPVINLAYHIKNRSHHRRHFLWKLHAALAIEAGDRLITGAQEGMVVDLDYSRFKTLKPFKWPIIDECDVSIIPPKNNTIDFFYLYNIEQGEIQLSMGQGKYCFGYQYDKAIFPYQLYFASYGKFFDHYTVVLEPCSTMPLSVNEAKAKDQCTTLEPGEEINTTVRIYAGENKGYGQNG